MSWTNNCMNFKQGGAERAALNENAMAAKRKTWRAESYAFLHNILPKSLTAKWILGIFVPAWHNNATNQQASNA